LELTDYNSYFLWVLFSLFVGIALSIDLGLIEKLRSLVESSSKRDKQTGYQENQPLKTDHKKALIWTTVWISLALIFAVIILVTMGYDTMLEYVTAYTLEKTLSVDNMFVFLLIFSTLGIPHYYQRKVLSVGILSAIAMRVPLILAGVTLLESFHWMIYVFGALILVTGIRMLFQKKEKKIKVEKNIGIRVLGKFLSIDLSGINGKFLFRKADGVLYATPLLVALVIVEMTDLVFALDSIPAVLAITSNPFIVITSNIFAILGLRSLYFLLAGVMEKFYYLKPALIVLLLFVGFKMIMSESFKIPITISLAVIFGVLGIAFILSIRKYGILKRKILGDHRSLGK
jgi:tellurite resistance protein TerC